MPRTASTSLFHLLGDHPGIFRPFRKEVGYFLFNRHRPEQWYLDAYAGAGPRQPCIDVTPEYFFSSAALERMAAFGVRRAVIGVRDPASFARSMYGEYGKRYRMPPFERFVEGYAYARGSELIEFSLASGVIRSMLDRYAREIPGVLFYDFSAFRENPLPILQAIEAFIGVDPYFTPDTFRDVRLNTGNRRSHRWLTRLLSAEPLISASARVLPARTLRAIARRVYTGAPAGDAPAPEPQPPDWLRAALGEDERFIARLFAGRAVHVAAGSSVTSQK